MTLGLALAKCAELGVAEATVRAYARQHGITVLRAALAFINA